MLDISEGNPLFFGGSCLRSFHCISFWIFPVSISPPSPPPLPSPTRPDPAPRALPWPMMYACISSCLRRRQRGMRERDEREGLGEEWKDGVSAGSLCSTAVIPVTSQGRRHSGLCYRRDMWCGFLKGRTTSKINLCALPLGWTHKTELISYIIQ